MAEGIVYLDVDDEITSAAQRIRSASGTKVALVVPYGSRIATSRMNFRLLSREALVSSKRLSIVSGDAGSRSLAASAGLPVFGSVGEYESTLTRPSEPPAESPAPSASLAAPPDAPASSPPAARDSPLTASATVVGPPDPVGGPSMPARKSQRPKRPAPDLDATMAVTTGIAAAGAAAASSTARVTSASSAAAPPFEQPLPQPPRDAVRQRNDRDAADADANSRPRSAAGRRTRAPLLAAVGLVGLAAIVGAVGAYVFLPSASIRLTPRHEPIGPIPISVAADPDATEVDVTNGIVPAVRIDVPVEASTTFETTGTHVELSASSGAVRFENYDPTASNTIVSGSIVATEGGVRFRTLATVTLPKAIIIPPTTITPSSRTVGVEAVKDAPAGSVPANSIRNVPQGENPVVLKVNNPNPTRGGARTETPEITKDEVDEAVVAVRADLQKAFEDAIESGAGAPAGTTLFPETAVLGEPVVDGDPQALVGGPAPTFDIRVTAAGSVIAVDPTPVESIAEVRLSDAVGTDHRLVDGSVDIEVGEGSVGEDGQVTFEATARATRVAVVDATALRELVKGRTAGEAQAALAPFGEAVVVLWPDWVTTVPTMESRLELTVANEPGGGSRPDASPSAGATRPAATRAGASARPSPPSPSASTVPGSGTP